MRKPFFVLLLLALFSLPQTALSWNGKGHRTVAFIAYKKLTHNPNGQNARAKVDELLRKHPDFATLSEGLSPSDPNFGLKVFIKAATWPDIIKSDGRFFDAGNPSKPLLPGFPDMERHRNFHFIDEPLTQDGSATAPPPSPNALEVIRRMRDELGNSAFPDNIQAYDLSWLIHLIGDVHQPLHSTSRFTQKHGVPEGDRGGNFFTIKAFTIFDADNPVRDLHSYWDGVLGVSEDFNSVKALANSLMSSFPVQNPIDTTEQDWIDESFDGAKTVVYTIGADEPGQPAPAITKAYNKKASRLARKRMALAGYRLAEVLNQKFQ